MATPTSVASGGMTIEVNAPYPIHGGEIDVLDSLGYLKDVSDPHLGLGVNYEQLFCGVPQFAPGLCDDALNIPPDTEKQFTEPEDDESLAFGIYKGIICSPFFKDFEKKTTDFLERGATYAVEQGTQRLVLDHADLFTPGTSYSIVEALALAEEEILTNLGSGGMIWVSRYGAQFLLSQRGVRSDDNFHLWTDQGTPIVNGAGFERSHNGIPPASPQGFFMWVTGPVTLLRGPVIYNQAQGLNTNTEVGLAEQVYAVTNPCLMAAVEVDPSK